MAFINAKGPSNIQMNMTSGRPLIVLMNTTLGLRGDGTYI